MSKKIIASTGWSKAYHSLGRNPNISAGAQKVYGALRSLNPCYPSLSKLQKMTGYCRASVVKFIKELVLRKLIKYERGNWKKKANLYELLPLEFADLTTGYKEIWGKITSLKNKLVTSLKNELVTSLQNKPVTSLKNELQKEQDLKISKIKRREGDTAKATPDLAHGEGPSGAMATVDKGKAMATTFNNIFSGSEFDFLRGDGEKRDTLPAPRFMSAREAKFTIDLQP